MKFVKCIENKETPLKVYCDNCKRNHDIKDCYVDCNNIGVLINNYLH